MRRFDVEVCYVGISIHHLYKVVATVCGGEHLTPTFFEIAIITTCMYTITSAHILISTMTTTKTTRGLIAALLLLGSVDAFTTYPSSPRRVSTLNAMDRRQALGWAAAAAAFVVPTAAWAADDKSAALDALGKELGGPGWPLAPSPLPSAVKSAAELTAPTAPAKGAMSDFEKAMQENAKKKQVDPRTHG